MTTKKLTLIAAAFFAMLTPSFAESDSGIVPNYDLAERFSPKKVSRMVFSTTVEPKWFKNSDRFWYSYKTSEGVRYYIVDPVRRTKTELFDLDELASELTLATKDPFDALHIPFMNLKLVDDKYFTFEIRSTMKVDKKDKDGKVEKGKKENKVFKFRYDIDTRKLTDISDEEKKDDYPSWANVSPDGNYALFSRNFNIYYMDRENLEKAMKDEKDSTIVEHQLTEDGVENFAFGGGIKARDREGLEKNKDKRFSIWAQWSPDSRYFALTRSDYTDVKELWVINVLSSPRPTLEEYKYQMPGEPGPKTYLYLFDMNDKSHRRINVDEYKDQSLSVLSRPYKKEYMYSDYVPAVWLGDEGKFYISRQSRDQKRLDLCVVHVNEDSCRQVIHEELNTYVEDRTVRFVNNSENLIQWSERDGWAHLYMYDINGNLKNRITSGPYHVEDVVAVDDAADVIYFVANGREKGINPYYSFLYRVNFDGSGLQLLTKGDFDNKVKISENGKYFVNNYSRVDCIPESALYDSRGVKIMDLEKADFSQLFLAGYKFPEIFKVKAGDGVTDLYGVMYKPFDFDSTKKYPLIEYVYPGPQTEANNSFWSAGMDRIDRLAQIGFIVVTVGNRGGHPSRSKWYHNYGYGNLRDYGLEDKKVAAQQLAARYDFIDGNKVGIHGHSGGGFMSTAAILKYPDFFKVAVSCAGNHDNRIYNRWWSEQHHGVEEVVTEKGDTTFKYSIKTNQELAKNLKGHLLLVHGDIDNNVHPGNTLRVVDALIKANKRFDMLILPGQRHGFGNMTEYFFWKMADYFAEHLLGDSQDSVDIPQMNNN